MGLIPVQCYENLSLDVYHFKFFRFGQTGEKVASPVFPFSLKFVPVFNGFSDDYVEPLETQLMTIPSGKYKS